jgi:hypothetical protein
VSFENDFLDCMPHTVLIAQPDGSFGDRGKPNFGADVSFTGRIVEKNENVIDDEGQERVSRLSIWLATTTVITPAARLTMPAGYTPTQPPIIRVERYPDQEGDHHVVLRVSARAE